MNGSDKTKIQYWDSSAYLAFLMNEVTAYGQDRIDALAHFAKLNFEQKVVIITSTITYVEVLASKIGDDNERKFRQSFSRDQIAYDVDPPIALKARDFRERSFSHTKGRHLSTPDAIHLATAALRGANEVLTFDDGKSDKRFLGMLELSGSEIVDKLIICKPEMPIQPPTLAIPTPPETPELFPPLPPT